jgi:hypothetical protein
MDILRPGGPGTNLVLLGRARDLLTGTDGSTLVAAQAEVRATVDAERRLHELRSQPDGDTTATLVGSTVASGFRRLVDATVPDHRDAQSPLYLLLDDLPVAALISGYADLYFRPDELQMQTGAHPKADICSGWRSDGTMMVAIGETGRVPVPVGPLAPPLERPDDALSWHSMETLPPGAMRRRRRIDVYGQAPLRVQAMFRDTHVDPDGVETVLHEYSVDAVVDDETWRIRSIDAVPRVLPWVECPWAAASAKRLEGEDVRSLRRVVAQSLQGISTCTHLNDMLRSLADVAPLARMAKGSPAN